MLLHIFHLRGILVDVISNPEPQVASVFRRELFSHLGPRSVLATGSILSHPLTEHKNQEMETTLCCLVS